MKRLVPARLLAPLRPPAEGRLGLPSDLLREARGRIWAVAGLGAFGYLVYLLYGLSGLGRPSDFERGANLITNLTGFWLCASVALVARLQRIPDKTVFRVALWVEVFLCLMISLSAPWVQFERTGHIPSLTWAVPIIILVPLLVPAPPKTTSTIAVLSGLTMPVGIVVLGAWGAIDARPSNLWSSYVTGFVAALLAIAGSRTLYGAGRRLAQARQIGSYQLESLLGKGGMGEVWKASHAFLARPAAVKLIRPEKLEGRGAHARVAEDRFAREAQATASMRSRHTIELYDFGRSGQGAYFYAMELLAGVNVEHFVYRFGAAPPARAIHWLLQACDSLAEAHEHDLVHRDVKPSNLYVCHYGRDPDVIKVLDFGLVKSSTSESDRETSGPERRLGTPGYMAPEQIYGQVADARTDIYALGCVAYWLLAGCKPFESDDVGDLAKMHVEQQPPSLQQHCEALPAGLEEAVLACLAKEPGDRPASMDEVAARLRAAAGDLQWSRQDAEAWWAGDGAKLLESKEEVES